MLDVVPAKAGTHNHRTWRWSELGPQLASTTQPCGCGSRVALRSPGTTWERAPPAHSVSSLRKQGPITTGRGDGASWGHSSLQQRNPVVWVPGRASLARDDVGKSATRTLSVVPAKAGTHDHRTWRWSELGPQLASTTQPCGYGSRVALRLPGTTWERAPPAHSVSSLRKQGPITTGRGDGASWGHSSLQQRDPVVMGPGSRFACPGRRGDRAVPNSLPLLARLNSAIRY
ncbi:hypothetical protein AB7M47_008692 [Bradyrhizobium elkanii]